MEASILNDKFETVQILDIFNSFIWTDRYQEAGDFEMVVPLDNTERLRYVKPGNYLYIPESEHLMIIEGFLVTTDPDEGNTIKITGRSLESILDRRIIWDQTILTGNFQNGIKKLLNDAIINPKEPQRRISNFVFKDSTDSRILNLTVDTKYEERENLYESIVSLCSDKKVGWRVFLNSQKQFEFSLYKGIDRSYAQNKKPWVVFSPEFDDLIDSSYVNRIDEHKNVCLVTGDDTDNRVENGETPILWTVVGHHVGLDRRETYVYAGSLTSEEEGVTLSSAEKQAMMEQAGNEELSEYKKITSMDGQVDPNSMFKYGIDYFIGDSVQIENIYGIKGTSVVSEFIMSQDTSGYTEYPTFTEFEIENDE